MCNVGSGTRLSGNDVICPGGSGVFECKTTNTDILSWSVNGLSLLIPGNHQVNDSSIIRSGNVATLVELNLTNGVVGDRTSLLRVPPTTDNVTITIICTGGDPVTTCTKDVLFKGNSYYYCIM